MGGGEGGKGNIREVGGVGGRVGGTLTDLVLYGNSIQKGCSMPENCNENQLDLKSHIWFCYLNFKNKYKTYIKDKTLEISKYTKNS